MNRALFARNARACENAKHPTCRCPCGGALHGTAHSAEWIDTTWRELEGKRLAEREAVTPFLTCVHGAPLGSSCAECQAFFSHGLGAAINDAAGAFFQMVSNRNHE